MKTLIINTVFDRGGAARGAYWLHLGLRKLGVDSKILTNSRHALEDDSIVSIIQNKKSLLLNGVHGQLDALPVLLYRNRKKSIFSTEFAGFNFKGIKNRYSNG